MGEHTSGPWQASGNAIYAGHRCVATTEGLRLKSRNADARLIAAAPDLHDAAYTALECLVGCVKPAGGCDDEATIAEAIQMLRSALARATQASTGE